MHAGRFSLRREWRRCNRNTAALAATVTGLSYGNATTLARTLNTRNLIQTTTYALGGTALSQRTLGYDENGNLSGISDSVAGCVRSDTIFCNGFEGTSLAGTDSRTYVYDAIDRLTQMTSGRYGTDQYTYDPLGNVRTNGATTWHYNAATNRVSNENGTAYGYDARGNVTSIGGFAPTWNLANEQVADSLGGGYAYDARGWRVKQTGGGHVRYFVYDSEHHLVERLDNNVATDFVTLGSLPVARITSGIPTYIHADYQNTPLFETGSGGAITRNPDYLAYGQPVDAQGTAEIPGYTGAAPDKDTGLLYLGARYLRAPRFLSVDPADLDPTSPMGLNRYAYANNNPARFTDPEGRCADADFSCGAMAEFSGAHPDAMKPAASFAVAEIATAMGGELLGSATAALGSVAAVRSAARVANVVEKSGGSINAAIANSHKAGLAQKEVIAAVQRTLNATGREMEVVAGEKGTQYAIGTIQGNVAPAVQVAKDGTATLGTATVKLLEKSKEIIKFSPAKKPPT